MLFLTPNDEATYYKRLAKIESGGNPNAKSPTSSASGLYQFTRATWEAMGEKWANVFDPVAQERAIRKLTRQNAKLLQSWEIPLNFATLYAAHFLGPSGAKAVLKAHASTPIENVTTIAQRKANRSILKGTAGDFFAWLMVKTGDNVSTLRNLTLEKGDVVIDAAEVERMGKNNKGALVFFIIVIFGAVAFAIGRGMGIIP